MKKFICTVCGYIHEGDSAPEKCPLCVKLQLLSSKKWKKQKVVFSLQTNTLSA